MYNGQPGRVRADADLLASQLDLRVPRGTGAALQALRRRLRRAVQGRRRQRPATERAATLRQSRRTSGQGRRQVSSDTTRLPDLLLSRAPFRRNAKSPFPWLSVSKDAFHIAWDAMQ